MNPFYEFENVYFQGKLVQKIIIKYKTCASCVFHNFCRVGSTSIKTKYKHLGECFSYDIFKEI